MGSVELRGGSLVVVCGGYTRSTGVAVNAGMDQAAVQAAVGQAISSARPFFEGVGGPALQEFNRLGASASARGIYRGLHPGETEAPARPAAPARPERPREERRTRAETPRRSEQPGREAPREERRQTRASTPRPTISPQWMDQQLRDARRDDRRAQAAASEAHSNCRFVEQYLSPELQRGIERTEAQRSTSIAVFNSLYQIPAFRLYLSSIAAQQQSLPERQRTYPEFVNLQAYLTEPGRGERLGETAGAEILRSADTYTRYFLFSFVAANTEFSRFREEIAQLPVASWRLTNIEGARTFQPASGRAPSERDRSALMRLYMTGPMDSDTVTASILYIRRWQLGHPERGRGRRQDQISVWRAPEIIIPQERAAEARPAAPTAFVPRVAITGDSLVAGGRMGTTLQSSLRTSSAGASVASYGVVSETIAQIRGRFSRQVLAAAPPYNTVIIQGGINGINGITVNDAMLHFGYMIREARSRGMRVVLVGITPWSSYTGSNPEAQRRTVQLNEWLRSQATPDGNVVFADMSALGEGNPPRLRQAYDSGDHLHPNDAGRDLMARQIAQAAFGLRPTATETRSALEDFAARNWANLQTELYQHAQGGNPAGVITLSRNLPEGHSTLEGALRTLRRDDLARATDRIFNEYMHRDPEFIEFCRGRDAYRGVALESVRMSAERTEPERRMMVRAMQAFINERAGRSEEWCTRLRDDLRILHRDVLRMSRDDIDVNGIEDVRTIAAIALFSWRKGHRTDAVGTWAGTLGIRPAPATTSPPRQTAPVAPPQPDEPRRRRVIQPGG